MELKLEGAEVFKFIRDFGIDTYDLCPCGSGNKYKFCCKKKKIKLSNPNDIKSFYFKIKSDAWNRKKWQMRTCHWKDCNEDTQRCHSIQNNRYLDKICDDKKQVFHFVPTGNYSDEKIELQYESVSFASIFLGFCNSHDRKLFNVIEANNPITFSEEQLYSFIYRNFYYMYCKKEVVQQRIIQTHLQALPFYYSKSFIPKDDIEAQQSFDAILGFRKNEISKEELMETISRIESNFNETEEVWRVCNAALVISPIRVLQVQNPYLCFQTVREYLSNAETNGLYGNASVYNFTGKRYSHISTIVLPDIDNNQVQIFFAISSKCVSSKTREFLENVSVCTDEELRNCMNNIILNAYEELYMSRKDYYDNFTAEEQAGLQQLLYKTTYSENKPLWIEEIFQEPLFPFI